MTGGAAFNFSSASAAAIPILAATQIPKLAAETRPVPLAAAPCRELIARAGRTPSVPRWSAAIRPAYGPRRHTLGALLRCPYVEPVWEGVDWKPWRWPAFAADRLGAARLRDRSVRAVLSGPSAPCDEKDLLAVAAQWDWRGKLARRGKERRRR